MIAYDYHVIVMWQCCDKHMHVHIARMLFTQ